MLDYKPVLERFGRAKYVDMSEAVEWLDGAIRDGNAAVVFAMCNRIRRSIKGIEDAATMQADPVDEVEGL